jgi:hypothetical protein
MQNPPPEEVGPRGNAEISLRSMGSAKGFASLRLFKAS